MTIHDLVPLANALLHLDHRIHIDGTTEKLELSVPFTGGLRSDTFLQLRSVAEQHGHDVISDFAASAVRFIPTRQETADAAA
jgi:hypothetical protein